MSLETGSEGGVAFSGLRHGDYSLRAEKAGYVDLLDLDGQGRRLTVAASGLRVEIRLCRAASISGVVRDWDGRPVQGAMIFAMVRRDAGDASRLARYGEARRTDELGRYRLFGLPPGHYSVGVLPRRRNTMEETLAPGFYYGSADPSAAVFFKLSAGDIRTSVDLTAPLATNASITGTVSGISNDPGPTRAAIALVARGRLQPLIAAVLTEEDGTFAISDVASGEYDLLAWAPFAGWASPWRSSKSEVKAAATRVSLSGGAVQVGLTLRPIVGVSGRVVREGCILGDQANIGEEEIAFRSEDGWPDEWMPGVFPEGDRFHVNGLPAGNYRIEMLNRRDRCVLARVVVGDQPTSPGAAQRIDGLAPLTLVLTAGKGSISGVVTTADGQSLTGIALLTPIDWDGVLATAKIDERGQYQFRDVPVGRYRVIGLKKLGTMDFLDPDAARNLGARLVAVDDGAELIVDMKAVED